MAMMGRVITILLLVILDIKSQLYYTGVKFERVDITWSSTAAMGDTSTC